MKRKNWRLPAAWMLAIFTCASAPPGLAAPECRAFESASNLGSAGRKFDSAFSRCRAPAVAERAGPHAEPMVTRVAAQLLTMQESVVTIADPLARLTSLRAAPPPPANPPHSVSVPRRGAAWHARAESLDPQINAVALAHDIDPLLLHAIIHVESRYNHAAVSPAGARGLMQVMPSTARRFGLHDPVSQLHIPEVNLNAGAAYLKTLQAIFGNNVPLVLAAYNAGEGAVMRYGHSIPPFRETQGYVRDVMAHYRWLRSRADRMH